ncbi:hypothetical protein predicted by Glimmer/Critica [Bacillus amyloliquefaciens DSM 7]|uniref:Uncharacterized protein n=1 Tax=Bacillus amyloliquefaciens (strain ATCC 23350 / DSM 7 / BCRC 11601 / CCUG 28519 / NBRC 15535 / NRRL B-14393 / F) TaxID=692420 RepID=A0A9P1JJZ9_BACAS|nr:hypothetical protein predicted by Glimmer/Critica [Bacillus amyloliquefaciens DSM 7] [Bacillus amyloliquefaciens DSM 7 = ATCC 23350]
MKDQKQGRKSKNQNFISTFFTKLTGRRCTGK